ncbi:hypothetical protein SNE35_24650 [Paucibacter sp. R3-3]|uniref:SCO family protein n=1 Tax=Roseateles agri TaxID=3098619 RepID=A0ABU5DN29_9BURK|nr:hypothetical protein [Paucibacter sp. R3-3]MDY0747716.1 hypothetical protein [Paucibacter sp. R3-3]
MDDPDRDPELRPRRVLGAAVLAALVVGLAIAGAGSLLRAWRLPAGGEAGSSALVEAIPEPRLQSAPQLDRRRAAPEFEQHLGARLPAGLDLRDADGHRVDWQALASEGRPLVLLPAYYRCDMLCGTAAHGALEALADTGLPPQAWRLLLFSVDPQDTPAAAAPLRQVYRDYAAFARPAVFGSTVPPLQLISGADGGRLAEAIGFHFESMSASPGFAHPTGLVVLTPDGTVSRYLLGVRFEPRALRAALVEASEGHVGTLADRLLLACAHLEPQGHDGAVLAGVRGGVLLSLAGLVAFVGTRRRLRR